jgi:hypothetical protein
MVADGRKVRRMSEGAMMSVVVRRSVRAFGSGGEGGIWNCMSWRLRDIVVVRW